MQPIFAGHLLLRGCPHSSPPSDCSMHATPTAACILKPPLTCYAGGWFTYTTLAAMNDALYAIGMRVAYKGQPAAGSWSVTDDQARVRPFEDGMVIPASRAEHRNRGQMVLTAYAGGAEVPVYASRGQPASTAQRQPAAAAARPAAAAPPAAVNRSAPPPAAAGGYGRWLGACTRLPGVKLTASAGCA